MFDTQLQDHTRRIDSAASRPEERTTALRSGIEWADDTLTRLNDDEAHATSEFHRRKAGWKRDVAKDEKPRLILEQIRLARTFRISGWLAIGIELLIATLTLFALLVYGLSFWMALIVSFLIASAATMGIAYVLHGGITALVARFDSQLESYQQLKRWFVFPSFVLMIISVVAYVAAQRMDAQTVYYLQPIISVAKFTAMFGFMVLGTALLVAADLLDWSRLRARAYDQIRNSTQKITSKRREWQDELDGQRVRAHVSVNQTAPVPDDQARVASGNGHKVSTAHAASTIASGLLVAMLAFGLSGCAQTPGITSTPVDEKVNYAIVIDASGIRNRPALSEVGRNLLAANPKIVEQQHVSSVSVHWFGWNGWTAEEKLTVTMPQYQRPEVIEGESGEIEKIRPDVSEINKKQKTILLKEAEAAAQRQYVSEVEKTISALTLETLVPPASVESTCTDVNGMMGRFVAQPNTNARDIVVIVTDGRQNCGERFGIDPVSFATDRRAVIIVLVPGTEADGLNDFEFRKSRFTAACSECVVVPYYRADLDKVIAEVFQKKSILAQK